MEIFDKIGKKASEAYKITADKTGKIAKETKLKLRMGEIKTKTNEIYQEIGKKIYEKHVREEEISIKKELEEECTKLDVLSDEMDSLLKQCLELRDKKQCQNCYMEIEKNVKYCPNCGTKQEEVKAQSNNEGTEEEVKEGEILDSIDNKEEKNTDIDEKQTESNEDNKENLVD